MVTAANACPSTVAVTCWDGTSLVCRPADQPQFCPDMVKPGAYHLVAVLFATADARMGVPGGAGDDLPKAIARDSVALTVKGVQL
jgi:hypothetical protein